MMYNIIVKQNYKVQIWCFIKTESTPNPLSYKFILPNVINNGPAVEISKTDNTDFCPMAKDILKLKEIGECLY